MMSDFASMDWDLQAVIRGSWSSNSNGDANTTTTNNNHGLMNNNFDPSFDEQDRDLLFNTFPEIFESSTANYYGELEGLYKPFYQMTTQFPAASQSQLLQQPNTVLVKQEETPCGYNNVSNHQNGSSPLVSAMTSSSTAAQVAKYKRSRKNQQKRVVQQARAEGLSSSDMWAWRKYGQKPIKGSPYPRSYYRCSSSKGCPARKQVEQSCADPGMYIITYTAEHNHSHPTRRNSLSGVARTKFSAPPKDSEGTRGDQLVVKDETFVANESIVKTESEEESFQGECDEMLEFMPDMSSFTDDLFPSLDDLHECIMDY